MMTMEEAIDLLQTKYHMKGTACNVLESLEIRKIAIEALQKEIPLKLEYTKKSYEDAFFTIIDCKCPTCGFTWSTFCEKEKRCQECGQRLEW